MVPVRIASLSVDAVSNQPVIVLRPTEDEPGEGRLVPIWIGHAEATAILLALQGMEPPRPMTHDLLKGIIDSMDVALARVEITRIEEGTFYAALVLRGEERTIAVDARPSDSIALAVRTHSPIFIAEEVIEAAAIPEPAESDEDVNEEEELERFREFLDEVNPEDFQG
jgi:bifunctional DNase/RNase